VSELPELIDVTDAEGRIVNVDWLRRSERVHRQLREFRDDYVAVMVRVFAGGGRMRVAAVGGEVVGVAVHRVYENTHAGLLMYVDDLVTDDRRRSTGIGAALLRSLEASARELGCRLLSLDSGTQRRRAHAFYLRERMEITSFHFAKALTDTERERADAADSKRRASELEAEAAREREAAEAKAIESELAEMKKRLGLD
jgi:GNAT superfamily N-acetyltransferase